MKIQVLHHDLKTPKRSHPTASGFDLFMPEGGMVGYNESVKVGLGFASEIHEDWTALLVTHSGAGVKGLELVNTLGVIDNDYRGEWIATLRMSKPGIFVWHPGDRLLQAVLVPRYTGKLLVVPDVSKTERGMGGFGSTGA